MAEHPPTQADVDAGRVDLRTFLGITPKGPQATQNVRPPERATPRPVPTPAGPAAVATPRPKFAPVVFNRFNEKDAPDQPFLQNFGDTVKLTTPQIYERGTDVPGKFFLDSETRPFRVLDRTQKTDDQGNALSQFDYTLEPADVYRPVQFTEGPELTSEVANFIEVFDAQVDFSSGVEKFRSFTEGLVLPITGGSETMINAEGRLFSVFANLKSYGPFLEKYFPGKWEELNDSVPGYASDPDRPENQIGTLNPELALWTGLAAVQKKHPDDYSAFISTDAGLSELWSESIAAFTSKGDQLSIGISAILGVDGLMQDVNDILTLSDTIAAPVRDPVIHAEEEFLPDIPFAKGAVIKTTELLLDPAFLGLMLLFPPSGVAAKATQTARLAIEIGAGEQLAEEIGAPEWVGALAGPLVIGPAARGFTKGVWESAFKNARVDPKAGEPATEILRNVGELPNTAVTLGPNGTRVIEAALPSAEVNEGRHVLKLIDSAGENAGTLRWNSPGHIVDVSLKGNASEQAGLFFTERAIVDIAAGGAPQVTKDITTIAELGLFNRFNATFKTAAGKTVKFDQAIKTVEAGETIAANIAVDSAFASRVTYTRAVESVVGKGETLPAMAGASQGPSVKLMDEMIQIHILRKEARDIPRKIAGALGHIPGMRQLVRAANFTSIVDNNPLLQGVFAERMLKDIDDATRVMSMASFRGSRVPFVENHLAQIWVPTVSKPATSRVSRALSSVPRAFHQQGEWIAFGDVFESVIRGEGRYLSRLTTEQVEFMQRADNLLKQYVRAFEGVTGQKLGKLPAWWPRAAVSHTKKSVTMGVGGKKVPAMYQRVIESQQRAVVELGIRYVPKILNQMEGAMEGFQKVARDKILADWLKKNNIIKGKSNKATLERVSAQDISPFVNGLIEKTDLATINALIRPAAVTAPGVNLFTAPFRFVNGLARMILTGTVDTGWGAIQLQTLAALNPALWGEAMGRGFYNMIVEPKQIYRYINTQPAPRRYATYGGSIGAETEYFQATRFNLPILPGPAKAVFDVATFPARTFLNRIQTGFESSLLYSRIIAFDSFYEMASLSGKGIINRTLGRMAGGPGRLEGEEFHREMFRTARFVDTLLGTPKLGGIVLPAQQQLESSFVFFAARYTRSIFGMMSYAMGRGFAPAQARVMLSKLVMGGAATYAGLTYAKMTAEGATGDEIRAAIIRGLNPLSGKEFMSWKIGGDWFGQGGAYRSMIALGAGLANKENWEFEEYDSKLWDNPLLRAMRTRTSPITGTLMDFLEGEDFLGYPIQLSDMTDNPKAFLSYMVDNNAPITMDALLQDMRWQPNTPRFIAEFFGLRTSPATQFEAETAVMNRVSQDLYSVDFEELEHNLLAQDIIRNHAAVELVTKGVLARTRERDRDRIFREWDTKRQSIRDDDNKKKLELDAAVTGTAQFPDPFAIPQTARMDGKVYRSLYGERAADTFNQIAGLVSGFGFEFEDKEAPAGSVNAVMNEYFAREFEDYLDDETLLPDWDAWFADGDAVLAKLPEEWQDLADEFLHKNQTTVKQDFVSKFDTIIKPSGYFRVRETVAQNLGAIFGFTLEEIEDQFIEGLTEAGRNSSPGNVSREVDKLLNNLLKRIAVDEDNATTITDIRNLIRESNPRLDVELYRQGYVSTVRSPEAVVLANQLMNTDAPRLGYFNAPLAESVRKALLRAAEIPTP